ncbi:MAG: CAP domain-containing protein [Pseudomonadota bacterium]
MVRLLILAVAALLTACVPSDPTVEDPGDFADAGITRLAVSPTPLALVNALRAESGLPALRASRKLDAAAAAHALDMARADFYGHTSPGGGTERDRMNAVGYDACSSRENIAWGQADAETVTRAWIASASHRKNILSPRGTDLGIAGVRDANGPHSPLWVMLIGAESC